MTQLDAIKQLKGAQAPLPSAVEGARLALEIAREMALRPRSVQATRDGGVAIIFLDGSKYGDIEFFDQNSAAVLIEDLKYRDEKIFEISTNRADITAALERIREHMVLPTDIDHTQIDQGLHDDRRMLDHIQAGDVVPYKMNQPGYATSKTKQLKWQNVAKFVASFVRIRNRQKIMAVKKRDAEVTADQRGEARLIHMAGRELGVGTPRADEILRGKNENI